MYSQLPKLAKSRTNYLSLRVRFLQYGKRHQAIWSELHHLRSSYIPKIQNSASQKTKERDERKQASNIFSFHKSQQLKEDKISSDIFLESIKCCSTFVKRSGPQEESGALNYICTCPKSLIRQFCCNGL